MVCSFIPRVRCKKMQVYDIRHNRTRDLFNLTEIHASWQFKRKTSNNTNTRLHKQVNKKIFKNPSLFKTSSHDPNKGFFEFEF